MAEVEELVRLLEAQGILLAEAQVVEVGCGEGEVALALAPHCAGVLGLDTDARRVGLASREAATRSITNAQFLVADASSLATLAATHHWHLVLARNTVQFLGEVEQFMEQVERLVDQGISYVQISSPLFWLGVREEATSITTATTSTSIAPSSTSSTLSSELEGFLAETCQQELEQYWLGREAATFARYCLPDRERREGEESSRHTIALDTEVLLLQLREHVANITVVRRFIESKGEAEFDRAFNKFLRKICDCMEIPFETIFFEEVYVVKKETFHVEIIKGKEQVKIERF